MSSEVDDERVYSSSDKKTDDKAAEKPQATSGFLWRMSAGLVNSATGVVTGAVGYGVSGAKWVAGKTVDAGSAIAHTTISVYPAYGEFLSIDEYSLDVLHVDNQ